MQTSALELSLTALAAGFQDYIASDANDFSTDSPAGLLAAFSQFVRTSHVSTAEWRAIAEWINATLASGDSTFHEALCTCFLENIASRNHPLDATLRGEALRYWRRWA